MPQNSGCNTYSYSVCVVDAHEREGGEGCERRRRGDRKEREQNRQSLFQSNNNNNNKKKRTQDTHESCVMKKKRELKKRERRDRNFLRISETRHQLLSSLFFPSLILSFSFSSFSLPSHTNRYSLTEGKRAEKRSKKEEADKTTHTPGPAVCPSTSLFAFTSHRLIQKHPDSDSPLTCFSL